MGVATALKRQLVLPKFMCHCERAESPYAILPSCILEGASTTLPFICPLESLFDVARDLSRVVPLRPWTFLNASVHKPPPGMRPFDLAADVTTVRWRPSADVAEPVRAAAGAGGAPPREVHLRRGLSNRELAAGLASKGAERARVLHLESAEGGIFGGFEAQGEAQRFQKLIMDALLGGWSATWCCTSNDKPRGTIQFKRPNALPMGEASKVENAAARGPEVPDRRSCYWVDRTCNERL